MLSWTDRQAKWSLPSSLARPLFHDLPVGVDAECPGSNVKGALDSAGGTG
jgi:hypothetical protein